MPPHSISSKLLHILIKMSTTNENNGDEFVTEVYDATFEATINGRKL